MFLIQAMRKVVIGYMTDGAIATATFIGIDLAAAYAALEPGFKLITIAALTVTAVARAIIALGNTYKRKGGDNA